MLEIQKTVTPSAEQWEITIEGMRNSFDSWDKSDSSFCRPEYCNICNINRLCDKTADDFDSFDIGKNDLELMLKLSKSGSSHSKFRRMLPVWVTINAPLYWWKEFDTYKVGTVCNSCSTMHKIAAQKFTVDDFSHEHLFGCEDVAWGDGVPALALSNIVTALNQQREIYLKTKDKDNWWQLIQLLPSSYNQRRTVMLNYEVLANIYIQRKNHKLDEWRIFCDWIRTLPYSEIIIGRENETDITCGTGGENADGTV